MIEDTFGFDTAAIMSVPVDEAVKWALDLPYGDRIKLMLLTAIARTSGRTGKSLEEARDVYRTIQQSREGGEHHGERKGGSGKRAE